MNSEEARVILFDELSNIAPEWDPADVDPAEDIRDAMDIDSMDLLNLVIAVHKRLNIDIPESDYAHLTTIDGAVAYMVSKVKS